MKPSGPRPSCQSKISFAAGRVDRTVALEAETPQFPRASYVVVIVVGDIEEPVVRRHQNSVGALDFASDDPRDLSRRVDAIDALLGYLHVVAAAVARVAEVDSALRIDGEVVGRIVAVAFVTIGEDGDLAARLGARDAAIARLADYQALLLVKQETVGAAGGFPKDGHAAGGVTARDAVRASEVQASCT